MSAEQINALPYLQQKMQRPLANNSDYEFLQQGVGWLNDFAQSEFKSFFVELDFGQKESLLRKIAQSRAGQNWLGMILNNLIEALLGDPVYGGNPNGIGWKAMGQTPGYPLPAKEERYYELGYQRRQRDYQKRIVRNTKG
ncbi:gluconate 2-dehydrogenase gamma chain [uncultured Thiomicrorhabdus sp.]